MGHLLGICDPQDSGRLGTGLPTHSNDSLSIIVGSKARDHINIIGIVDSCHVEMLRILVGILPCPVSFMVLKVKINTDLLIILWHLVNRIKRICLLIEFYNQYVWQVL